MTQRNCRFTCHTEQFPSHRSNKPLKPHSKHSITTQIYTDRLQLNNISTCLHPSPGMQNAPQPITCACTQAPTLHLFIIIVKNVHDARSTQWRHRLLSLCLCHATVSYRPGRAAWVLMTKRQAQRCHPRARSDSHAPRLLLSSAHPCGPGPCAHQPGHLPGCLCAARRGNDCQIRCAAAA